MTVRATDPDGKSAATTIDVTIINVNDNVPELNLGEGNFEISKNHDLDRPVLVINATDADGTDPVLKIGHSESFVLIRNELYLTRNLTSKFSETVQILAIDAEDSSSVISQEVTISVSQGLAPVIAGIIGAVLLIVLIIALALKICSSRKYAVYRRGAKQLPAAGASDEKLNSQYLDFQGYQTDNSEYAKLSIRKNDGRDSGRGDSDSNPDTLTDWCQPECLTLGHSDSCWLPANQRYSGQFAIEVGPNTPKHRLEVVSAQICDRTSDYSSYNSGESQAARQAVDNRLSQILTSDVIV